MNFSLEIVIFVSVPHCKIRLHYRPMSFSIVRSLGALKKIHFFWEASVSGFLKGLVVFTWTDCASKTLATNTKLTELERQFDPKFLDLIVT